MLVDTHAANGPAGATAGTGLADESPRGTSGRRLVRWIPALLLVVGVVFDVSTPATYTAGPFLAAAPLVAASLFRLRATVITAVFALAAAVALAELHGVDDPRQALAEILTVATVTLLAILINRLVRRSDRRLASARGIAEAAQRAVLPVPPARLAGLDVAARYVAAEKYAAIGGDLYAVQDTPHGVRLVVGDVRGKGLQAVESVAILIGSFREAAEQETTLEGLAGRLERALQREGARRADLEGFEGFTTAVLAEIPRGDSTLRVINRGHPPPLLLEDGEDGEDGEDVRRGRPGQSGESGRSGQGGGCTVRRVDPAASALPLGMGELGGWPDRVTELRFAEGATLLLFTDGVTEARDREGAFYDPEDRLRGQRFGGPGELLDALVADVERHTGGGTSDDMALLALRRRSTGPGRGTGNGQGNGDGEGLVKGPGHAP